ncbi:MAG: BREX-4 system phosphatase PglZ [Eubacteriales bacterium]
MKKDECIEKIEKYLQSSDFAPRLVNVNEIETLKSISEYFFAEKKKFVPVTAYTEKNNEPQIESLQNILATTQEDIFVTGLTSYLKLTGKDTLIRELRNFTSRSYSAHVVVLCYQCEDCLTFSDSRAQRLVYKVEGNVTPLPKIVLVSPEMQSLGNTDLIDGIAHLTEKLEQENQPEFYVKTKRTKNDYRDSIYFLEEKTEFYEILVSIDQTTNDLNKNLGTDEQWSYALEKVQEHKSWFAWISSEFSGATDLSLYAVRWANYTDQERWLYFIALKLYGGGANWCLQQGIDSSTGVDTFLRQIYRSTLDLAPESSEFWVCYQERKNLLSSFGDAEEEVSDFLQILKSKEDKSIYYLTDSTQLEKEEILRLLQDTHESYGRVEIVDILSKIYPDLFTYLEPYHLENQDLEQYFQEYKHQKVINHIFPEFLEKVQEYGKSRDYNLWLPPRVQKVDTLAKEGSRLYFVDAMGAEYLNFIMAECKKLNLMAKATLCRCELPSITSMNKEFLDGFTDIAPKVSSLDEIKHHPIESLNYHNTKLPVHLLKELEIIRDVLTDIRNKLAKGTADRACIISDHGASRLAVIHEQENQWEMASKGVHSGRCCPVSEVDIQSEYATESNDFWSLANYDRFKGGRKASVEVHGGATLEEVVVPIIEFSYITGDIEVLIQSELPIEVSFRKKAEILLFSKTALNELTVCVNGKGIQNQYYKATPRENNVHHIYMPEVKQAGEYSMSVYSNNNLISELSFSVKKESAMQRDIL